MSTPLNRPGGKPAAPRPSAKADATITALAMQMVPEALATLEELLADPGTDPTTTVLAAEAILNFSVGRPPSHTIEVVPEPSPELRRRRQESFREFIEYLRHYVRTKGPLTEEVEHLEALVAAAEDALPEFT